MSDIKELVKRLRCVGLVTKEVFVGDVRAAADALEALVAERDRLKGEVDKHKNNYEELCKAVGCPKTGAIARFEAAEAERDRLKDQNNAWADQYGDAQNAMYNALDERDSLREVIDHMSFNWIDCSDCDRNREMMKSFINKEEKKEI